MNASKVIQLGARPREPMRDLRHAVPGDRTWHDHAIECGAVLVAQVRREAPVKMTPVPQVDWGLECVEARKRKIAWVDFAVWRDGAGGAFGHGVPCPY